MRSLVVAEIFLLFLLVSLAQGIRLEKGFKVENGKKKINEEERFMTKKSIGDVNGDAAATDDNKVTVCNVVKFYSGKNRKLVTMTPPITNIAVTEVQNENGTDSKIFTSKKTGKGNGKHGEEDEERSKEKDQPDELYPDMSDIAEMDYSSTRRKIPIHN